MLALCTHWHETEHLMCREGNVTVQSNRTMRARGQSYELLILWLKGTNKVLVMSIFQKYYFKKPQFFLNVKLKGHTRQYSAHTIMPCAEWGMFTSTAPLLGPVSTNTRAQLRCCHSLINPKWPFLLSWWPWLISLLWKASCSVPENSEAVH